MKHWVMKWRSFAVTSDGWRPSTGKRWSSATWTRRVSVIPNCPVCDKPLKKVYVHALDSDEFDLEIKDGKIEPDFRRSGRVDFDSGPYCYNCNTNLEKHVKDLGLDHINW
jgi:hypothetical protein